MAADRCCALTLAKAHGFRKGCLLPMFPSCYTVFLNCCLFVVWTAYGCDKVGTLATPLKGVLGMDLLADSWGLPTFTMGE